MYPQRSTATYRSLLFGIIGQQSEPGYQEKGWEGDSVEDTEDRDYAEHGRGEKRTTLRAFNDALDEHQTPRNNQCLHGVREGMCLVGPSDVRRGHEKDSNALAPLRFDQLMDRPVF